MAAMGLITVLGGITILALAADSAVPKNDPARGLIYDGLKKPRSGPCAGIFEFKSLPGQCTSGPTPFPRGVTAKTNATPAELAKNLSSGISAAHSGDLSADTIAFANEAPSMDWPCSGNSTNQKLIEMVYVYKAGAPNHFNQYKSSLELMAKKIEGGYVESARLTSNTPIYARFETDASCNLVFRQYRFQMFLMALLSIAILNPRGSIASTGAI